MTLDNYYTSRELGKAWMLNGTDCFGTLRKNPIFQVISRYGSQSVVIRQKQRLTGRLEYCGGMISQKLKLSSMFRCQPSIRLN